MSGTVIAAVAHFFMAGAFFTLPQRENGRAWRKAVPDDVSMTPPEFLNDPLDILISHL
ncbi:MAG TPA: hypothetical protein VIY67_04735 [Nitrospiraceae bacterium]